MCRWFFLVATSFAVCGQLATMASEPPVLSVAASSVSVPLAVVSTLAAEAEAAGPLGLIELNDAGTVSGLQVAVQRAPAAAADGKKREHARQLLAVLPPGGEAGGVRRFRLQPMEATSGGSFRLEAVSDASLGLWHDDRPVLVYNHGEITGQHVPQNDPRRRRGCYVHPVWGPHGEIITDDFPEDHYHHHGLFWAWPHVQIGDEQYNLWTYADIQQRFVRWICRQTGPVAGVLAVENGWFVGERQVMIERVWIRAFATVAGRRAIDITLTWIPLERAVTLWGAEGKSYGGLTMRFAPGEDNLTAITVPAGRAREDLLDTPLRWADYSSRFAGAAAISGATVMCDPSHPDFPPTWLTRHYGALCVGYPGVRPKTFPAGEPFTLKYRVSVHDGPARLGDLQREYDAYVSALQARWSEGS